MGSQETWGKTPTDPVLKLVGDGSGPRGASREGYSTCKTAVHIAGHLPPLPCRKGLRTCWGVGYTQLRTVVASGAGE